MNWAFSSWAPGASTRTTRKGAASVAAALPKKDKDNAAAEPRISLRMTGGSSAFDVGSLALEAREEQSAP